MSSHYAEEDAPKLELSDALADYKEGEIPTFAGLSHADLQQHDLKIVAAPYMIIGFVVIGILGLLTDQLFKLLRRWLLPWSASF